MRRFSLFASLSIFGFLLGGCAADAETTGSTSDAVTENLSADVRLLRREAIEGLCEIKTIALTVELLDSEVTEKINRALTHDWTPLFAEAQCHEHWFEVDQRMSAEFNERNWLTVQITTDAEFQGLAPMDRQYAYKNFDLRTGALVPLTGVVDAQGADILVAACKEMLEASPYSELTHLCDEIHEPGGHDSAFYAVGEYGIYVVPASTLDPIVPGVHVDWAALRGHITHPTVAAIANAANPTE